MTEARPIILVVEDEPQIRRFVRRALEAEGFGVVEADSLHQALREAAACHPVMALLDLGLPDGDGTAFIRELRGWSDIPVIVLSARTTETDKVQALDAGADDYLTKPFGVAELMARVRAQHRRHSGTGTADTRLIVFGSIQIDLTRRSLERAGEPVHLTPIEYRLLVHLARHPHAVLTYRQLLKHVWGPSYAERHHYVRIHMGALRKKIEADPARPRHLVTETGIGYRFVP